MSIPYCHKVRYSYVGKILCRLISLITPKVHVHTHTHAQKCLYEFVMARAQDSLLFHRFINLGVIILYSLDLMQYAIANTHLKGACLHFSGSCRIMA